MSKILQQLATSLPALDTNDMPLPIWTTILKGAGLGLLWGIIARIWMRLISTQPEFSIAGTAGIFIIATFFGTCAGFAYVARRQGWRGWKHYLPRALTIFFFLPFGIAGGSPLMLTVLIATLALNQSAAVNLWALSVLVVLASVATDIAIPKALTISIIAGAILMTLSTWIWKNKFKSVHSWLECLVQILLLLVALAISIDVIRDIITSKPFLLALLYSLVYIGLLVPLFLALRIGLKPKT